jgi:hypothetical protein
MTSIDSKIIEKSKYDIYSNGINKELLIKNYNCFNIHGFLDKSFLEGERPNLLVNIEKGSQN